MLGEPVVIVRRSPGGNDQYGDPLPATETRTNAVSLTPLAARYAEDSPGTPGRDGGRIVGTWIAMPYSTDLREDDLLEVRGTLYAVDGEPFAWRFAGDMAPAGMAVNLRRAEVGSWQSV